MFSNLVRPRCKYTLFCINSLVEEVHSRKETNRTEGGHTLVIYPGELSTGNV